VAAVIEKSYQVVVTGELMPGTKPVAVQQALSRLFNTPIAKLEVLLLGKRMAIKKGMDETTARRLATAVQEAGLRCAVEEMRPAEAPRSKSGLDLAPVGSLLVEPREVSPPDIYTDFLSIAPVGADLSDQIAIPFPQIDTGSLSVAPVGTILLEPPSVAARHPALDTSGLHLAPTGSDLGEVRRPVVARQLNIAHLSLK
jgi:hypothetical protein